MKQTFSPNTVTWAGLVLVLVEFLTGATELPHILGETAYGIVALVLGAIGVACTFILRAQIADRDRRAAEQDRREESQ